MYTGCLENQHGFYPLRDPKSKWFISYEEMPDSAVRSPAGCWPDWAEPSAAKLAKHEDLHDSLTPNQPVASDDMQP